MVSTNINGNIEVTDAIEQHIQHHADKLQKFGVLGVEVHLKKLHKTQFSAVLVVCGKSATANSENMYTAITNAFDKIETVLSKDKNITLSKRNQPVHFDLTEDEE